MPHPADIDWNQRYATQDTPWDSGRPSHELKLVLKQLGIQPCRALELGCGTGTNAVFLARQGFKVTALELSPLAVEQAKEKARQAKVRVNFLQGDLLRPPRLGGPFPFVFDRGVYHCLRCVHVGKFRKVLASATKPGSLYFTLAGNANEPQPEGKGPPTVQAQEMLEELGGLFELVQLREFRFDGVHIPGRKLHPLGWSALWRRRKK